MTAFTRLIQVEGTRHVGWPITCHADPDLMARSKEAHNLLAGCGVMVLTSAPGTGGANERRRARQLQRVATRREPQE